MTYKYNNKQIKLPDLKPGQLFNYSTPWWRAGCDFIHLLQSPKSIFLCKKWAGAHLVERPLRRKYWIRSRILTVLNVKKRKARNLCTTGTKVRRSCGIPRGCTGCTVKNTVQEGWFTAQRKADLRPVPGRQLCSTTGPLHHLLWQQCPGHSGGKDMRWLHWRSIITCRKIQLG